MPVKSKKPDGPTEYDEFERITRWRFKALLEIGLAPDQAMSLIETPDVAHAAQKLADAGCPPGIIASLLAKD
jgi:hypothetical protein